MALNRMYALGRLPKGKMNKTEEAYSKHLDLLKRSGEIQWYMFEGMKFKLADKTYYTPDFNVMRADGLLEMHEVKGYWQDDARVKIKIAANDFPVRFLAIKKIKNGWDVEVFNE